MDRRTFNRLAGLVAMGVIADSADFDAQSSSAPSGAGPVPDSEVVLEDDQLLVAFNRSRGALTRIESKSTHWLLERRPELGVSFRLLVSLPGRRANFVLGQKQRAAEVSKISDHEVRLRW